MGKGLLKIELTTGDQALPVGGATIIIRDSNNKELHKIIADKNGMTERIELPAPDQNSDGTNRAMYNVEIPPYKGYTGVKRNGVQIFDGQLDILPVDMHPKTTADETDEITIPYEHGCDIGGPRFGGQDLPEDDADARESELARAIRDNNIQIPDYITVHLGSPNSNARNVRVSFMNYIKNVATSEIYPNWEASAITANILAQITFTLNRLYTEWYRSQGKDFDITNDTRFDQYFVEGRDIANVFSLEVDRIFNNFLKRLGRAEPYFSIYYDGRQASCCGMSQWGSQDLARRGYTPIQILRNYYPRDIDIYESTNFGNFAESYPGYALSLGDRGEPVRTIQYYLNRISGDFWIPNVGRPDGVFGQATEDSVKAFQRLYNLTPDGVVGRRTWYEMVRVYVAVKKLAELDSEGERIGIGTTPPTSTIRLDARGEDVVQLQFLLNYIGTFFNDIPYIPQNGVFREPTRQAVLAFQRRFGITADGVVGPATWRRLYEVYNDIGTTVDPPDPPGDIPPFPGTSLRNGSRGNDVLIMQNYLNRLRQHYPSIPQLTADGIFGPMTERAVRAFQTQFRLASDGIIGPITWYRIIEEYNLLGSTTPPLPPSPPPYPGTALRQGSRGDNVRLMQRYINAISRVFPVIPGGLAEDGVFGPLTDASVRAFQNFVGITADGVIGPITWNRVVGLYGNLPNVSNPTFPGTSLRNGSSGENVRTMQRFLSTIASRYPSVPRVTVDGNFGAATQNAVLAFQRQFGLTADGIIGRITWNNIVSYFNLVSSGINLSSLDAYTTATSFNRYVQSSSAGTQNIPAMILLMNRMMGRRF